MNQATSRFRCTRRSPLLLCLLIGELLIFAPGAPAQAAVQAGQPLAQAIELIRAQGVQIIYSSALVPPALYVIETPRSTTPLAQADEILAPHGLRLRHLRDALYAIERMSRSVRTRISGRVVDDHDRQPIAGARVEIAAARAVAWTRPDGSFTLVAFGTGPHTLEIRAARHAPSTLTIEAARAQESPLVVTLATASADIDEITVLASRYTYKRMDADGVFALDRDDIRSQPTVGEDAMQSVVRLPGFAFSGLSARPNVRGGEDNETLILLDGMPIRQAFHMPDYNAVFSVLDEDLIGRIDAFTGALPARHGNRTSAIIELESRDADELPRHALGASVFNASARTSGRLRPAHLEWLAAGRVGTLRPLLDEFAPDIGRPSYADAFAKLAWHTQSGASGRAHVLWANDELSYFDPESGEHAELTSRSRYAWVTTSVPIGEEMRLDTLVGASSINSVRTGSVEGGLVSAGNLADSRNATLWDMRASLHWEPADTHSFETGITGTWGSADYDYSSVVEYEPVAEPLFGRPSASSRAARVSAHRGSFAWYAADRWQPLEHLFVEIGGRLEHERGTPLDDHTWFSPRLAARWDIGARTRLRMSWARTHQQEEVQELQIGDGIDRFQDAQRVTQLVFGLEYRLQTGMAVRTEVFRKSVANPRTRFENLFDPLRFLPELSPDRIRIVPDAADLEGVELSAQWERGSWNLWGAYTWSRHTDRIDGRDVLRSWDQTHTATLAVSWRRGPWTVSGLGAFHTGRPTTPIESDLLSTPRVGERNSTRLGRYGSVDLRIERLFPLANGRLRAFAQVTNLLGRRNPCCSELDLPDDDDGDGDPQRLEIERQFTYPLLPAVGVAWEF